jgi:hypothetical protein
MSRAEAQARLTAGQIDTMQRAVGEHDSRDALVRAYQTARGLAVDGWPGLATQTAIHADGGPVPLPVGRSQVASVYGALPYTEGERGRVNVAPAWVRDHIVAVELHTGKRVRLHRLVADEFAEAFRLACEASGYTPASVQTYVPRHTLWDRAKPLSLHSWGIAIDFDPSLNRMGGTATGGGPSMLRQHPEFIEVFKSYGWTWGGDWRMRDDMHIQRAS